MDRCLDDNELQGLFLGTLPPARAASLQRHVDACSACRRLVAEVARTTGERELAPERTLPLMKAPAAPHLPVVAPPPRVVIRDGKVTRRAAHEPANVRSAARALGPGSVLAERYRLERVLGEGGTGVVWEATHTVMRRRIALKLLKSNDAQAQRRFLREARVTAALRHPHIVEVHDVFTVPETGTLAMVMELLEGAPLSRWIRTRVPAPKPLALTVLQAARVALPVISALGAAHGAGVVHRDLKPENVFLVGPAPTLDAPFVKVLDFGLAKLTAAEGDIASSTRLTRSGFVLGTPHYMAPEQISDDQQVGPGTDVWALGVLLYECLCGRPPFGGSNLNQVLRAIVESKAVPVSKVAKVPRAVGATVMQMLSRNVSQRPSLSEVHAVLSAHAL